MVAAASAGVSSEHPINPRRRRTTTRPNDPPSIFPRVVAGSIGSIVTAVAVTPLEVVKVRQQASRPVSALPPNVTPCPRGCGIFILNNGLMDCVLPRSAVPYFDKFDGHYSASLNNNNGAPKKSLGTFGMMRRIFMNEGIGGIYAGLAPTLVMSVPNTVLYFTSYDEIVTRLRRKWDTSKYSDLWIPLVSGSSARFIASVVTSPLELIRTRQASLIGQSQTAPGVWGEFRLIVQNEGPGALYQGLGPTLWRDVPFSAIYWFCLEQLKILWDKRDGDVPKTPPRAAGEAFVNGAVSGMIAAAATTPFDVVKTRQQTATDIIVTVADSGEAVCHHNGAAVYEPPALGNAKQKGTMAMMKEIAQTEGIPALWRGNQTRMIKVAPACAIMISCYELGKRIME